MKTKNIIVFLLVVSMLFAFGLPASAAETCKSGAFEYRILADGTAEITSVDFGEGQTELIIPDQLDGISVTSIGYYAMNNNAELETVVFPQTLTKIGNGAFSLCQSLAEINLPESLKIIDTAAFFGCSSLITVEIPNGVQSIGNTAFRRCYSLESVIIPESVTSIGRMAFFECDSLKSVTLPESVQSIGEMAFGYTLDDVIKVNNDFLIIGDSDVSRGYADENGLVFIASSTYLLGDANMDGAVTISDVTAIQRRLVKLPAAPFYEKAADIDGDGLDINDALNIQRHIARFNDSYGIGRLVTS